MKKGFLKWGLLYFVLVLTCIGCPNPNTENLFRESLEVRLPDGPSTFSENRTIEDLHSNTNPHYYQNITLYLGYTDPAIHTYSWSPLEMAAKIKLIPGGGMPSYMFLVINGGPLNNAQIADAAAITTAYNTLTAASQNVTYNLPSGDANGNLQGSYIKSQTVFLSGMAPYSLPHPTLDNTRQATFNLASSVARFELGTLKATDPAKLTSISVDAVYVNNYYTTIGKTSTVQLYGSTWNANKPADGHWSKITGNNTLVTSNSGTKCYSFQLITGLVPQFIYEISGTLAAGVTLQSGDSGSFAGEFVTVSGFTELASSTPTLHHVYKIGLTNGGIAIDVEDIGASPNVNALEIIMTIYPWNETTLTPNI